MNNQSITSGCWHQLRQTAVYSLLFLCMLFGAQTAMADNNGNPDIMPDIGCMEDVAGFGLNCTANDIQLADVTNVDVLDDGCAYPGDDVTFTADFEVLLTAQARHDIGIWFAQDGGDALTGTCTAVTPAYAPDPPWLDLDGTGDTFPDTNVVSNIQDTCGDIDDDHNPQFPRVTLTVQCLDSDGNGLLDIPNCTSWRQPGANDLCTGPEGAYPGSPSKCRCASIEVPIEVPDKFIEVVKVLSPAEDGGLFNLLIDGNPEATDVGHNGTTGRVEVVEGLHTVSEVAGSGTDLLFYDTAISCVDRSANSHPTVDCPDCTSLNVNIPVSGADYLCTITNTLALRAPDFTVVKTNNADGDSLFTDTETVPFSAVYPVTVPYKLEITNNDSLFAFTIDNLTDDKHNTEMLAGCSGLLGQVVAPLGTVDCTFNVMFDNANLGSITNLLTVFVINGLGPFNDADDSTVIFEQDPSINIVKSSNATGTNAVGDTITYTYDVENTGNVTLTNLQVTDPHSGLSAISCSPIAQGGTMAPGDTTQCSATYTVTQADVDAGQIDNTGTATGTPPSGPDVTDDDPLTEPVARNPAIDIVKSSDATGTNGVGDTITYTYDVENTGNVTLTNLQVTDPHSGLSAISCSPIAQGGTMAPGDTTQCTATYTVTQADVDAGEIDNIGTATGTPPIGDDVSDDDPLNEPVAQTPAIDIVKSSDATGTNGVGDTITYTYDVENTGNVTLTNLQVTDPHSGLSAISCSPIAQGGTMAPGDTTQCTATYTVTQADVDAGEIDNIGTATGTPPIGDDVSDDDPLNEPVAQTPAIDIVKSSDATGTNGVGDTITYTYDVENTGNVTLTNLQVTDPHSGLSAISCSPIAQGGTMAPGDTTQCTATYTVTQADVDAGEIDNIGTATGTPPIGDDVSDDDPLNEPVAQTPAIDIVKSSDATGTNGVGDTITYTYDVENTGNVTLTNLQVTDPHSGLSAISCSPIAQGGTMAPGDTTQCTATYTVTQADVDAGEIDNIGTATGTPPIGDDVSDDDPLNEPVAQTPAIDIVKSSDATGTNGVGDTITYTYDVENTGNVTLTNLQVTDPHSGLSAISCSPIAQGGTMAPGDTTQCTATYTVTQADVDAGEIDNIGTATGTPPIGDDVSDDDPLNEPVAQTPAIDIVKSSDATGTNGVGDTITYTYDVENTGNVTLTNLQVTDPHSGLSAISCSPIAQGGTMAPGDTTQCTATYTVTQADVDAGEIDNIGTATGTPPIGDDVSDDDPLNEPVAQTPAIDIVKSSDATGTNGVGDTITYTYDVENTGNVTLTNLQVTDPHSGLSAISCSPIAQGGTMAPGDTTQCTATYTVTQADVDAGEIDNIGTATGTPPIGDDVSDDDPLNEPVAQTPAIDIVKSSDATGTNGVGDTITYTYDVENTGNVTLTNLQVTDPHSGLSAISCSPIAQGGTMAPGDTTQCTATYTVTQADVDAGEIDNIGTATGTPPIGDDVSDDDPLNEPVAQTPAIDIVKSSDATGTNEVGDTITYTYDVENTGNVTLTNLQVTDPHSGLSAISCSPIAQGGTMAPGDTTQCTATYTVTQADVDAGEIDNIGTATGTPPIGDDVSDDDPLNEPVAQTPAIDIVKSSDATGTNGVGDTITYTYDVENTGNVTLTNLQVTDPHSGLSAISCSPIAQGGTMAPGDTTQCTATYTVTQADVDAGEIDNIGTATGTPPIGDDVSDDDPLNEPVAQTPAIDIVKSSDATGTNGVGDTITYTYDVENTGNVTLTNLQVTDPHSGLSAISCSPIAQGGTMAPGDTTQCTATYTVTQADVDAGEIDNIGTATGTPPIGDDVSDDDPLNEPVAQTPAIDIVKSSDATGTNEVGDTITYTYDVENTGNVTLTNLQVTDPHSGLSAISCSPIAQGGTMAPGDTTQCTATYTVTQADVDAGEIDNIGTATGTPPIGDDVSDDDPLNEPVAQTPAIDIVKSSDATGTNGVGDTITYTYDVENTGNVTLTNLQVTDPHSGLSAISCSPIAQGGTMAPGDTTQCTATYTVTQADVDAGEIDNIGTATGTPPIGDDVSDDDPLNEPVAQTPAIDIVKSSDATGTNEVGDTITYTYDVENTGNVTLTNLQVTDPHSGLSAISCSPIAQGGTMAPGDTTQCTATYTVTQADVDAGEIDNIGTATGTPPIGDDVSDDDPLNEPVAQTPAIMADKVFLSIVNDADGNGLISSGDTIAYRITATNIGNITLNTVTVDDDLTMTENAPCAASLAPGESCSVDVTYDVLDTDPGPVENIGTVTGQCTHADCPVSDTDPELVLVWGDVCENAKPTSLTMLYEGDNDSDHSQDGNEVIIDGDSMGVDPAYIIVEDHRGRTQFSGYVDLNDIFIVGGSKKRISPRHAFFIYDEKPGGNTQGTLKETVQFHTSCSQDLFIGDEFGSLTVFDSTD
ncbi:DUF7507 domain-containing protein [Amphritea sp. HPY]|uniref:DUF7507 domain-containing protein n=1 Tax=Amphritea sp. HPY TaxID=3421652 RepID=UPI003D7DA7FB